MQNIESKSDDRRLTTDRFYGGTEQRLSLLSQFLSFVLSEQPTGQEATDWLLEYSNASSRDAISRHLNFLDAIDLLETASEELQLGTTGEEWLKEFEDQILYGALNQYVAGFDIILQALLEKPRSDAGLMGVLNEAGPFDMGSPGVAARHREWLEVLGYVRRENGMNELTSAGKRLASEKANKGTNSNLTPIPDNREFEPGKFYSREKLHDVYGGQRYRGIATPADAPAVFLFTGDSGSAYGYEDEFQSSGNFLYTGEGTKGDMTMDMGNAAIRNHQQNGKELHLFENTDEAWVVQYIGEFEYVDHHIKALPDETGELRDAIRFELAPIETIHSMTSN